VLNYFQVGYPLVALPQEEMTKEVPPPLKRKFDSRKANPRNTRFTNSEALTKKKSQKR